MNSIQKNSDVISTYIITSKERKDKLKHVKNQFLDKPEFDLSIIQSIILPDNTFGVWQTIKKIVKKGQKQNQEFILICEDDHEFTEYYSKDFLFNCIAEAKENSADLVYCGINSLQSVLPISKSLFWTEGFGGAQFIILFNQFFKRLLGADFKITDSPNSKIGSLTNNRFFIYPFLSRKNELNSSNIRSTNENNAGGKEWVNIVSETIEDLINIIAFYSSNPVDHDFENEEEIFDSIFIPTYVINLPERIDRREHIIKQFEGKNEFNVTLIEACQHEIGAVGLWNSIRKIIKIGIENDNDLILICEDDHEFTEQYSKEYLLRNIIEAHLQGADILYGGIGGFYNAVCISGNRFWIDASICTQFIVLYKKFFQQVLDEPFDDTVEADHFLSGITLNKMVLSPFISVQKGFGYSDVTSMNNITGILDNMFAKTSKRLEVIQNVYNRNPYKQE